MRLPPFRQALFSAPSPAGGRPSGPRGSVRRVTYIGRPGSYG